MVEIAVAAMSIQIIAQYANALGQMEDEKQQKTEYWIYKIPMFELPIKC